MVAREIASVLESYWENRIRSDLSSFADPGTTVELDKMGRRFHCEWISRNNAFEADFEISIDAGCTVNFKGSSQQYSSFLASPELGDLKSLAKMMLRAAREQIYVETQAHTDGLEGPATEILSQLVSQENDTATKVIMLTGDAGAGKTSVLREIVRKYADDYVKGKSSRLLLYVNAQGRALARFNEALATELQDLRSKLTYHAVAPLTRAGIIVPVIDGFDELLGVSGYDDAFNSLSRFIEELEGEGKIVASARSAYYEEEFVERADSSPSSGQIWEKVAVRVKSWSDAELEDYIQQRSGLKPGEELEKLREKIKSIMANSGVLRTKPLFVSRVIDLVHRGEELSAGDDLLEQMIAVYIQREIREKLLDRNQNSLLSAPQVRRLLCEIAEELWNQETRELDRESAREVSLFVLEDEGVPEATLSTVLERVPNMAFLTTGDSRNTVAFEHELFFSFFFGNRVVQAIKEGPAPLRMLLSRSTITEETANSIITSYNAVDGLSSETVKELLQRMSIVTVGGRLRLQTIRENAGAIMASAIRACGEGGEHLKGLVFANLNFAGGSFGEGSLEECEMRNCVLRRTDLMRSRIIRSRAQGTQLQEIRVDPDYTRLELDGLDPHEDVLGLQLGDTLAYDPEIIMKTLQKVGAIQYRPEIADVVELPEEVRDLLDQLMMTYRRTNPVCVDDQNLQNKLFSKPAWQDLRQILEDTEIVVAETRATSGKRKTFLRRQFLPEQILQGRDKKAEVPHEIREFWNRVERHF